MIILAFVFEGVVVYDLQDRLDFFSLVRIQKIRIRFVVERFHSSTLTVLCLEESVLLRLEGAYYEISSNIVSVRLDPVESAHWRIFVPNRVKHFDRKLIRVSVEYVHMKLGHYPNTWDLRYWDDIVAEAEENGWDASNVILFDKPGYEIYIGDGDVLELSIKDPHTSERINVVDRPDIDHRSPEYAAILLYLVRHAEEIVHDVQQKCEDLSDLPSYEYV